MPKFSKFLSNLVGKILPPLRAPQVVNNLLPPAISKLNLADKNRLLHGFAGPKPFSEPQKQKLSPKNYKVLSPLQKNMLLQLRSINHAGINSLIKFNELAHIEQKLEEKSPISCLKKNDSGRSKDLKEANLRVCFAEENEVRYFEKQIPIKDLLPNFVIYKLLPTIKAAQAFNEVAEEARANRVHNNS